jgi:methyl-accepting chemotaxis protein
LFEAFGIALLGIIDPILVPFTWEATAPVLSLLAFVILLVLGTWFWLGYVRKPCGYLGKLEKRLAEVEGPEAFVDAYARIPNELEGSSWLARAWKEFDETTIQPPEWATGGDSVVKLTVRPDLYFNRDGCGLHYSLWQAIPNYMIGIGLVFTFLGLVAALREATGTIGTAGGDVAAMQEPLRKLLVTAGNKFLISIAALSSSIILSFVVNRGLRRLDHAFRAVCDRIEELSVFRPIEAVAEEQLRLQRAQAAETKTFMSDIGMQMVDTLASRLDAKMAESLRRAIEPLQHSVDRLASGLGQQNTDALAKMVEAFRRQFEQGAGSEMQGVAATLRDLRQVLDDTGKNLNAQIGSLGTHLHQMAGSFNEGALGIMQQFERGTQKASDHLAEGAKRTIEGMGEQMTASSAEFSARLEQAANALGAALGPLEGRLGALETVIDKVGHSVDSQVTAFGRVNAETRQTGEALSILVASLGQASRPIEDAARQMRETTTALDGMQRSLGQASEQNRELAERLGRVSGELERSWTAYADRFEQVDSQLERVFKEFLEGTRAYQALVKDFNADLDRSLGSALKNLGGGIKELGETLDEHADTLRELLDRLREPA